MGCPLVIYSRPDIGAAYSPSQGSTEAAPFQNALSGNQPVVAEIFGALPEPANAGPGGQLSLGAQPGGYMSFFGCGGVIGPYSGNNPPTLPDGSLATTTARLVPYNDIACYGTNPSGPGTVTYWDYATSSYQTWTNRPDQTGNSVVAAASNGQVVNQTPCQITMGNSANPATLYTGGGTFTVNGVTVTYTSATNNVGNTYTAVASGCTIATGSLTLSSNSSSAYYNILGTVGNTNYQGAKITTDWVRDQMPGSFQIITLRTGCLDDTNNMENLSSWQEEWTPYQILQGGFDQYFKVYAYQLAAELAVTSSLVTLIRLDQESNGNNYPYAYNVPFDFAAGTTTPCNGPRLLNALVPSATSGTAIAPSGGSSGSGGYGEYAGMFRHVAGIFLQTIVSTFQHCYGMTHSAAVARCAAQFGFIWCVGSGNLFPLPSGSTFSSPPFPQYGTTYAVPQAVTSVSTGGSSPTTIGVTSGQLSNLTNGQTVIITGTGIPAIDGVALVATVPNSGSSFTVPIANSTARTGSPVVAPSAHAITSITSSGSGSSWTVTVTLAPQPGCEGHGFPQGSTVRLYNTGISAIDNNGGTNNGTDVVISSLPQPGTSITQFSFQWTSSLTSSQGAVTISPTITSYVGAAPNGFTYSNPGVGMWMGQYPGDDNEPNTGLPYVAVISMDGYNAQHTGVTWKWPGVIFQNCYNALSQACKSGAPVMGVTETACIDNPVNQALPLVTLGLPWVSGTKRSLYDWVTYNGGIYQYNTAETAGSAASQTAPPSNSDCSYVGATGPTDADGVITGATANSGGYTAQLGGYLVATLGTALVGLQVSCAGVTGDCYVTAVNATTNQATLQTTGTITNGSGLVAMFVPASFNDGTITVSSGTVKIASAALYGISTSNTSWTVTGGGLAYCYIGSVSSTGNGTATLVFPFGGAPTAGSTPVTLTLTPPSKADWFQIGWNGNSSQSFGQLFPLVTSHVSLFDHDSSKTSGGANFLGTYNLRDPGGAVTGGPAPNLTCLQIWRNISKSDPWFTTARVIPDYPSDDLVTVSNL